MLNKLKNNWFSLIEVVVATSILTVSVFWVYKLIWENTKLITNFDSYKQSDTLFISFEECIDNIWFNYFKNSSNNSYNFNFWNDLKWCFTWTTNNLTIDNIDYKLSWIITNSWADFIDWDLAVSSENNGKINKSFVQFK